MKIDVKVPSVGESIVSGILARWVVKNGASVAEGEILFEMETDKVNVEVPSPASGKIEIITPEGEEVAIEQLVARIDTDFQADIQKDTEKKPSEPKAEMKEKIEIREEPKNKTGTEPLKTSPAVRRIAGENDLDLRMVEGTGKEGRITKGDVLNKQSEPKSSDRQTVVKMSPIRRTIARNLLQAKQEAAHLTTFNEINMEHVSHIRSKYKDDFLNKYGIKLGFMSFFVKASCQALKIGADAGPWLRAASLGRRITDKRVRIAVLAHAFLQYGSAGSAVLPALPVNALGVKSRRWELLLGRVAQ